MHTERLIQRNVRRAFFLRRGVYCNVLFCLYWLKESFILFFFFFFLATHIKLLIKHLLH